MQAIRSTNLLEKILDATTTTLTEPLKYPCGLHTTNRVERLIEEPKWRERIIRVFPNETSALHLMGDSTSRTARKVDKRWVPSSTVPLEPSILEINQKSTHSTIEA